MSKLAKLPIKVVEAGAIFFVTTFTIYFFNLDMKATSLIEPFIMPIYEKRQRNQRI